jgi:ketosteroid isomerase-like protein
MSRENVEIVRRAIALRNSRDFDDMSLYSPELVYRPIANFSESEECCGHEEFRHFMEGFFTTWADDFTAHVTSIRDHGDRVTARAEFSGHARASGIPVSGVVFQAVWLRDGLITRIEDYASSAEALKAVGMEG